MKKHVLMMLAVCLLALSTKANDLAEQLCDDEVFVAMVKESDQVTKHVLSLNESQRKQYLLSEEFICFRENFLQNKEYLSVTYNLFERTDSEIVIQKAIKKIVLQKDARWCEQQFGMWFTSCFTLLNSQDQIDCWAAAQAWYEQCLREVGGVD